MNEASETTARHWLPWIFGLVLALFGLALAAGGSWVIALGGSWYYLPAGLGFSVAGVLLLRGRVSGAWWYGAVLLGTLGWSAWESGLEYWRWIPRIGLVVAFGFVLALLLPKLDGAPSRAVSRSLAVLFALVFIGVLALAFLPHRVTEADGTRPERPGVADPAGASAEAISRRRTRGRRRS